MLHMLPQLCQTVASAPLQGHQRGRNLNKDWTFQEVPNTQMACRKNVDYTFEIVKQVSVLSTQAQPYWSVWAQHFPRLSLCFYYYQQNYPVILLVMNALFRSLEY